MSRVWIQTEEVWRKKRCYCDGCFGIPREPNWINSDQLVEVLNSAANKGPDRDYVLRSESGQAGKALASGARNASVRI